MAVIQKSTRYATVFLVSIAAMRNKTEVRVMTMRPRLDPFPIGKCAR